MINYDDPNFIELYNNKAKAFNALSLLVNDKTLIDDLISSVEKYEQYKYECLFKAKRLRIKGKKK